MNIYRRTEKRVGRKWEATYTNTDPASTYRSLAVEMFAKYRDRATWVKRITDRTNYDGTRTVEVYYDNGFRTVYRVDI